MRRSILLTALLALTLVSSAIAIQPGDTLWTSTYTPCDWEDSYCRSVQQTDDGGYILCGNTRCVHAGFDAYIVKTDAVGDTVWTRVYGGDDYDYAYWAEQTGGGGYIVAGYTRSFGLAGGYDAWLLRLDANGDTLWTKTYGGEDTDYCYSLDQTSDGGFVLGAVTKNFGAGSYDVWLVKTDANGDTLWTRTFGGLESDYVREVHQTADGGYMMAGYTSSMGAGSNDFYLVKTDSAGTLEWEATYGDPNSDYCYAGEPTSDGGYIMAGYTNGWGADDYDILVVKADNLGFSEWIRTYGYAGSIRDRAYAVRETDDGGYIFGGYSGLGYYTGEDDVYLVKTDGLGDTVWTRSYGYDVVNQNQHAQSIALTDDDAYIVGAYGKADAFGPETVMWLLKLTAVPGVSIACEAITPTFCRGSKFSFKLTVDNPTGGNVTGILNFRGHSGYDCDPLNVLATIPREKTFVPGITEYYYFFKVPNAAGAGQYSASIGGDLGGTEVSCCMNVDILDCSPWRTGTNTEWGLVEVDRGEAALPTVTSLHQNYPNPFNANTTISFSLAEASNVELGVYDLSGRLVTTLVEGEMEAGEHLISWDASEVSSGVYFYKLTAGEYRAAKRMMLVK
jgi:hypothetical protein